MEKKLSNKQLSILAFPYTSYDALICDGAIRSGKTSIMTIAFVDWAMRNFNKHNFAICGKTVGSTIKNVVYPYRNLAYANNKYAISFNRSENKMTVSNRTTENYFYVYGGKDESSYELIQGITLAGVMLDEVALLVQSFVNQAVARCSVEGSKFWFNCNPDSPTHWFYKEWILKANKKNALYLHFLMNDNPSLSQKKLEQYENLYSGVFYDRYIKGMWVLAEGLVYPMFNKSVHVIPVEKREYQKYYVSMDYGIQNPTAMLLIGVYGDKHYVVKEYYHSGRETKQQKTDEQYYAELLNLCDGIGLEDRQVELIIDPSASSFIALARQKGDFIIRKAKNDVIAGIQYVARCLTDGVLFINECCVRLIGEFGLYSWDSSNEKEDKVIKENDHAMDGLRYYCFTKKILKQVDDFF